ncbi:hypothetical protein UFOVP1186_14 [uncultured Caudovirales phage]|uniref:Holin n=1 Tax=uncultured Caudovirales phage TaxID=2100421 RepID=A0A6J5Q2G7_9CAUD|nr:hypothetical protein UFOVP959_10 [uncultured Caudovirales phage]CAB4189301.1 hypothetical protein UFOVP1186_14 [uncultured Caudovirales phage]CAB4192154.1 hypothetical protein UFOVP1234_5 [uncultured Caudovirales phage]CAB4215465.1 hypothetical protein UFOVP1487_18 [uncultured Caudovirales phage]CAB5238944.1 hypothetical protein UFOVP1574_36 [uncultured Caudovirales phage]
MMDNPLVRLAVRALLVAVTAFLTQIQGSDWDAVTVKAAVVGAVLAAVEVFTPINPNVGPLKKTNSSKSR